MSSFVRVIVDRSIRRELDYSVPEAMTDKVVVGARVRVPFRDKSLLATVVATLDQSPAEGIKPIMALLGEKPILSASLIELARWMSNYYCCPVETVMQVCFRKSFEARRSAGRNSFSLVQPATRPRRRLRNCAGARHGRRNCWKRSRNSPSQCRRQISCADFARQFHPPCAHQARICRIA